MTLNHKAKFLKTAIALFYFLANLCNRISMRLRFLFLAGINQTGEEFLFIKVLKRRNCLIDGNTFDCGEHKIGWISLSSCCLTRDVREVLDDILRCSAHFTSVHQVSSLRKQEEVVEGIPYEHRRLMDRCNCNQTHLVGASSNSLHDKVGLRGAKSRGWLTSEKNLWSDNKLNSDCQPFLSCIGSPSPSISRPIIMSFHSLRSMRWTTSSITAFRSTYFERRQAAVKRNVSITHRYGFRISLCSA